MSQIELTAHVGHLTKALAFVREKAAEAGLNSNAIYQLEIAVEEALVNVMLYAYPNPAENSPIGLEVLASGDACQVIITDLGGPFDPTEHVPEVDNDAEAEERDLGGLGIFFMYKYADAIRYVRLNKTNQLTLIKNKG